VDDVEETRQSRAGADAAVGANRKKTRMNFANMTSAHFIFIPVVLFVGIVIGWILGSRAAQDAIAMEMKRRQSREQRTESQKAT
jgi:hypothetical protein